MAQNDLFCVPHLADTGCLEADHNDHWADICAPASIGMSIEALRSDEGWRRYVPGRVMELSRASCLICGAAHRRRTLATVRCRHPLKSGRQRWPRK